MSDFWFVNFALRTGKQKRDFQTLFAVGDIFLVTRQREHLEELE